MALCINMILARQFSEMVTRNITIKQMCKIYIIIKKCGFDKRLTDVQNLGNHKKVWFRQDTFLHDKEKHLSFLLVPMCLHPRA